MRRKRFAVALTLLVVFLTAVVAWGGGKPRMAACQLVFTLTYAALATSVLQAVTTRSRDRPGWVGFALFGWVYLLANTAPMFRNFVRWRTVASTANGIFVTERVFDLVGPIELETPPPFYFMCHCVTSLLAAALGMAVAGAAGEARRGGP